MSQRFFVEVPIATERVRLGGTEAHHLLHVMRAAVGTEVILWDGSGVEYRARVVVVDRTEAELEVLSQQSVNRELEHRLTIGVALPKGDRQRWLVEKAVELGVQRVVPLKTERGVAQPGNEAVQRLRRTVIEAAKQCGRNRLMEIDDAMELSEFLAEPSDDAVRWLAHPAGTGQPTASAAERCGDASVSDIFLAVGPEGGFTRCELDLARQSRWQPIDLGPRILRTETAAMALAALWALR